MPEEDTCQTTAATPTSDSLNSVTVRERNETSKKEETLGSSRVMAASMMGRKHQYGDGCSLVNTSKEDSGIELKGVTIDHISIKLS